MTCESFLSRLDALEDMELPPDMESHAASCPDCGLEAQALQAAIRLYRLPDMAGSADLVPRISAMLPFLPQPRRTISMRDWVAVGGLIILSMVLVPLLSAFDTLTAAYGPGFTLPLALVLGLVITLYSAMFIISHLDDFSRRLRERQNHAIGHAI